jgi:hypothetical protein
VKRRNDSEFVCVLETNSSSDCVFLKSILDAEAIVYFIQGEHVAPYVYHALPMRLMVKKDQAELVKTLLKDFKSAGSYDGMKNSEQ